MQTNTKHLFELTKQIIDRYEELSEISGENFNIFKIINLTSEEVRVHSAFIAELLNPKGSHGQKEKFLKIFIDEFKISDFDYLNSTVEVEKYIGIKTENSGGRIDILVQDCNNKTIIIENKIYAGDENNQLVRYHNYSKDNVFYLNLFGDSPTKKSRGNLKQNKDFKVISYRKDIINWLEICKKESINSPLLREGISHYINLIKYLTGRSNSKNMEDKIVTLITSSPDNMKSAFEIANSLEQVKIKIQYVFWKSLKEKLATKLKLNDSNVKLENVENYYKKSRNNKLYGFWSEIYSKNGITIHYGIEIYHKIYFGFTIEKNGKGGISNLKEFEHIRKFVKDIDENYTNNENWLGWKHTNPILNFNEFKSNNILNLTDEKFMDKITTSIVEESIRDINALKEKLTDNKV